LSGIRSHFGTNYLLRHRIEDYCGIRKGLSPPSSSPSLAAFSSSILNPASKRNRPRPSEPQAI
jgi:hypothetical protein